MRWRRNPSTNVDARTLASRRDRGATLVEISIAIVLLGIGVTSMLTMLTVTIQASATERDHANAHAWLQTAADVLYGIERVDCNEFANSDAIVLSTYDAAVKGTSNPEGWPTANIRVVPPVLYWNGDIYQSTCYDNEDGILLQLVTLEVRNPEGRIVETVQVVKG